MFAFSLFSSCLGVSFMALVLSYSSGVKKKKEGELPHGTELRLQWWECGHQPDIYGGDNLSKGAFLEWAPLLLPPSYEATRGAPVGSIVCVVQSYSPSQHFWIQLKNPF